jgi:biotin transport system substrate-specific component
MPASDFLLRGSQSPEGKARMSQARVLADRIYSGEGIAADALRIIAANILLALCAHIAIPLPWTPVPITGQSFGIFLVAVLLGSTRGTLTVVLYLLEGMAGLPVFAPIGAPGPARFFGPTAGFLFAYPPAVFVAGWLVERSTAIWVLPLAGLRLAGALLSGEAIIFLGGWLWLAYGIGLGAAAAFFAGVLPFLPGETIKMAMIVAAVRGVELARRHA